MTEAEKLNRAPECEQAALLSEYHTFIQEILRRLDAIHSSLAEVKSNPDHTDNWKNCDFCWFEIRKICEYLTLAIMLAHHCDGDTSVDLSKWRPKDILAEVGKLSDHPTPLPISADFSDGADGKRQITPLSQPISAKAISAIYGQCSELLHVGSLERILAGKLPSYDLAQLERWSSGFSNLLLHHALLMPRIRRVLIFSAERLLVLEADGDALFDRSDLPEFEIAA